MCTECGDVRNIMFLRDAHSEYDISYIACPDCGPTRLNPGQITQQSLETRAVLEYLFAGIRRNIQPVVADRLWKIGRRSIAGRSRELWFIRGLGATFRSQILEQITGRPRTILFTPTTETAKHWRTMVTNPVLPIEECVEYREQGMSLCWDAIEDRIIELDEVAPAAPRVVPKRASRTAKIERLTNELKTHLHSAIEYAMTTADQSGYPELLPRPTQDQLARQAEMHKSDVSRCLKDTTANELRLLWQTAGDLNAVLRLRREKLR